MTINKHLAHFEYLEYLELFYLKNQNILTFVEKLYRIDVLKIEVENFKYFFFHFEETKSTHRQPTHENKQMGT